MAEYMFVISTRTPYTEPWTKDFIQYNIQALDFTKGRVAEIFLQINYPGGLGKLKEMRTASNFEKYAKGVHNTQ